MCPDSVHSDHLVNTGKYFGPCFVSTQPNRKSLDIHASPLHSRDGPDFNSDRYDIGQIT